MWTDLCGERCTTSFSSYNFLWHVYHCLHTYSSARCSALGEASTQMHNVGVECSALRGLTKWVVPHPMQHASLCVLCSCFKSLHCHEWRGSLGSARSGRLEREALMETMSLRQPGGVSVSSSSCREFSAFSKLICAQPRAARLLRGGTIGFKYAVRYGIFEAAVPQRSHQPTRAGNSLREGVSPYVYLQSPCFRCGV